MRLASSKEYNRLDFDLVLLVMLLLDVVVEQDNLPPLSLFSTAIFNKRCALGRFWEDKLFPTAAGTNASEHGS